jgi:prepilin-type N-terminal cleavage/methylation domain-containing protein
MSNAKKQISLQKARGFTLLELLVATAVFIVIAGAALALFSNQQPLFNRQQNFAGLNISMRNAVAQMQLDVVNAGTGYFPGTNIPGWPVGVTIVNSNPVSACNTPATYTYSSTCFDQLNVIAADANTPPAHLDNGGFAFNGTDCIATTASPIYVYPPAGTTPAALAGDYHNGDQLLLVDAANSKITTILLSGLSGAGGTATTFTAGGSTGVKLTFNVTNADGTNTNTNDPLSITTCLVGTLPCPAVDLNPKLNTSFCYTDWILRLAPITYQVSTSNPADPVLTRTQGGVTSNLAEQVIGFKVGAVAWNVTGDTIPYSYNASNSPASTPAGYSNQWWLIRSVQVALIARTTPVTDPTFTYRNGFDGGPYQIESEIATVNPRNLSMNNN